MTQDEIKKNFSHNISRLRKENGLTQLALAEKLNYSDKAISKWEVGSVVPDVQTMSHIADFFGVTINDLVYPPNKRLKKLFWKNHVFITLISFGLVWFLSTIIFFILSTATHLDRVWLTFIIAIPISMIVLIVFSSIWFNKAILTTSISGLFWSIILNIYLIINKPSLWFIFIIGIVGQLLIIFWAQIKRIVVPNRKTKE